MKRTKHAFSLIELLSTLAVMGVLLALTGQAVSSLLNSSNLATAGQMVADQINVARQLASARNNAVEVRLLTLDGESGITALQLWSTDALGVNVPLGKRVVLPPNTVIGSDRVKVSPALERLPTTTSPNSSDLPNVQSYVSLRISASGCLSPAVPVNEMNSFYLSIVPTRSVATDELPQNYVTVQVNPNTGTPLVYRP